MNFEERMTNLDLVIAEGRLIRKAWSEGSAADAKQRVCLLVAMSPECGEAKSAGVCPSWVMPTWLAYLTPWMDDNGSDEKWPSFVRRYAKIARRWDVLSPEQWRRLDFECRAISVRSAREQTKDEKIHAVVDSVLVLLERASHGDSVTVEEWHAAEAAAASWAAREASASAARVAAARVAAAASWAAREAARAAAAAWAAASWAAAWAAAEAASDRISEAILDAIEREIGKAGELSRGTSQLKPPAPDK